MCNICRVYSKKIERYKGLTSQNSVNIQQSTSDVIKYQGHVKPLANGDEAV